MKDKNLKTRKAKTFSVKLECTILSETEFYQLFRYYDFVGSSFIRRKVDSKHNYRSFYKRSPYTALRSMYFPISIEEYKLLPLFVCVESWLGI